MNQLLIDWLLFIAGMAAAFAIVELDYRQAIKKRKETN